jgi:hypothetical protein
MLGAFEKRSSFENNKFIVRNSLKYLKNKIQSKIPDYFVG